MKRQTKEAMFIVGLVVALVGVWLKCSADCLKRRCPEGLSPTRVNGAGCVCMVMPDGEP